MRPLPLPLSRSLEHGEAALGHLPGERAGSLSPRSRVVPVPGLGYISRRIEDNSGAGAP